MALNDVKITTKSVNAKNSIGSVIGGTPNSNPIAQLRSVNAIGIESLADKGVKLPESVTTYDIMQGIKKISNGDTVLSMPISVTAKAKEPSAVLSMPMFISATAELVTE